MTTKPDDICHHTMVLNKKPFICINPPSFPHKHHMREREDHARVRANEEEKK